MSKTAIVYYRASTSGQKHTIDRQKEIIKEYCTKNGIDIILEVEEICSGMKKYQINLCNLLDVLEKEKCVLICSCPDRLTREYTFGKYIVENYNVIFCSDPSMSHETKLNELYFAEKEVKKIRERTKNILDHLRVNGMKLGNPNAIITKEQRLNSIKSRKEIALKNKNNILAKEIIESMLLKTSNCSEIARYLNEHKYKTSKNKEFCCNTVKRLIKRYNL